MKILLVNDPKNSDAGLIIIEPQLTWNLDSWF